MLNILKINFNILKDIKRQMLNTEKYTNDSFHAFLHPCFKPNYEYYSTSSKFDYIDKNGNYILNPSVINIDKTFFPIKEGNKTVYTKSDARLYNSPSGTQLGFDSPPLTTKTDECENSYKPIYNSYADINFGNVIYYTPKNNLERIFPKHLFNSDSSTVVRSTYIDPMGVQKPQWNLSIYKDNPILSNKKRDDSCLSFFNDTQYHREDLMSLQMRRMNSQRYDSHGL